MHALCHVSHALASKSNSTAAALQGSDEAGRGSTAQHTTAQHGVCVGTWLRCCTHPLRVLTPGALDPAAHPAAHLPACRCTAQHACRRSRGSSNPTNT